MFDPGLVAGLVLAASAAAAAGAGAIATRAHAQLVRLVSPDEPPAPPAKQEPRR